MELFLGIIGTLTGIGSLMLHFLKYRKERPKVKVELEDCCHSCEEDMIKFRPIVTIRNMGDRPSTIFKMELWALLAPKRLEPASVGMDFPKNARLEINDTIELKPNIKMPLPFSLKKGNEEIEIALIIHHTLGETIVEGISRKLHEER
jgi:hypothetical protein